MESIYIEFCYHSFADYEYKLAISQFHSDPMTLIFWIENRGSDNNTRYSMKLIDKEKQTVIAIKYLTAIETNHLFNNNNYWLLKLL